MTNSPVFRTEAIEHLASSKSQLIKLSPAISFQLIAFTSLGLCILLILFVFFGTYTNHISVSGTLEPNNGLITVLSTGQGVASKVGVSQSDTVAEGAELLTILGEQNSTTLGLTRAQISSSMSAQRAKIKGAIITRNILLKEQERALENKYRLQQIELNQLNDQIETQTKQYSAGTSALERTRALLSEGYLSLTDFEKQQASVLDHKSSLQSLIRDRSKLLEDIGSSRDQKAQLVLQKDADVSTLEDKDKEIEQSLAQNELQRETSIKSPASGLITSLLVKSGESIAVGQPLLSIFPKNSVLEVHLLIPSRAIGFIKPNSRVNIRYQAFPYQKFGPQGGRVSKISTNALSKSEALTLHGVEITEASFLVTVEIDSQFINAYGFNEPLKAGMLLDADILLDNRRLIEWILEPLYAIRNR